jgi:putative Mn2+ efflux pump MntP
MFVSVALRVALLAGSLALDVFAVCVGVGMQPLTRPERVRIGAAFASAEVIMTLIGVGIGELVGRAVGNIAGYLGFAALIGVGCYMIFETTRDEGEGFNLAQGWGLFVASLSISLDSLGIGFSVLYLGVPLWITLVAIAVASVLSSTLGLVFGRTLGKVVGERAALLAGIVLVATGVLFATLKYAGIQ